MNFNIRMLLFSTMLVSLLGRTLPVATEESVAIAGSSLKKEALACRIRYAPDDISKRLAKVMVYDLSFTDQLQITTQEDYLQVSKNELKRLFAQDVSLCCWVKAVSSPLVGLDAQGENIKPIVPVEVVVYDTSSGEVLLKKSYQCDTRKTVVEGHHIAADILEKLTGTRGIGEVTLAYAQDVSYGKKVIYVSDYAGMVKRQIATDDAINVAPSWHSAEPLLFYSRLTPKTSDLIAVDLGKRAWEVKCSFKGLNMQPSFCKDGSFNVVCLAKDGNVQLYQCIEDKDSKPRFNQLTQGGNALSPIVLDNKDIIFCSDVRGRPQIYYMNNRTKKIKRLTNGQGACAAPTYCPTIKKLAYSRLVGGIYQLCTLDLSRERFLQERQITFNPGDKMEPCFSACGAYLFFAFSPKGRMSCVPAQIAVLNCHSGKMRQVTAGERNKGYPACSNHVWYAL